MRHVKLKIWLFRYSLEFRRKTGWGFIEGWKYGNSTIENFNSDLEDLGCPVDMVSEDLSCWSD